MKIWLLKVIGGATLLLIVTLFLGLSYQSTLWIAVVLGLIIVGALFALYQSSFAPTKTTATVITEEMIQEEKLVEAAARTEAPRRVVTRSSYTKTIVDASRSIVAGISSLRKYAKIPVMKRPEFLDQLTRPREESVYVPLHEEEIEQPQEVSYVEVESVQPRVPRPSLRDLIERGPVALQEEVGNEEPQQEYAPENPNEMADEVFREITQSIEEPIVEANRYSKPVVEIEEQVAYYEPVVEPQNVPTPEPTEERVVFGRITSRKAPVKKVAPVEIEEDEQYPDLSENEIEAFVIKPPRRRTKRLALQEDEIIETRPIVQEEIPQNYGVLDTEEEEPVPVAQIEPQRVFTPESDQSKEVFTPGDPTSELTPLKTPTGILKKRIIRKTLPQYGEDSSPRVGYTKRYEVLD